MTRVVDGDQVSSVIEADGHYNRIRVTEHDVTKGTVAVKTAFRFEQLIRGTGKTTGQNNAIEVSCELHNATANTQEQDGYRYYCAGFFSGYALVNDNGTAKQPKGAVYGLNPVGSLGKYATHFANVTAIEANTNCVEGSSVYYKSIIQLASQASDTVSGSVYDAMLSFSGATGSAGWKDAMLFSGANGQHPLKSTGSIIRSEGPGTILNGVDISSYTILGVAWRSPGITIYGNGLTAVDLDSPGNNAMFIRNRSQTRGSIGATYHVDAEDDKSYVMVGTCGKKNQRQQFFITTDSENPFHVRMGAQVRKLEIGPVDSGGPGYRSVRVRN